MAPRGGSCHGTPGLPGGGNLKLLDFWPFTESGYHKRVCRTHICDITKSVEVSEDPRTSSGPHLRLPRIPTIRLRLLLSIRRLCREQTPASPEAHAEPPLRLVELFGGKLGDLLARETAPDKNAVVHPHPGGKPGETRRMRGNILSPGCKACHAMP